MPVSFNHGFPSAFQAGNALQPQKTAGAPRALLAGGQADELHLRFGNSKKPRSMGEAMARAHQARSQANKLPAEIDDFRDLFNKNSRLSREEVEDIFTAIMADDVNHLKQYPVEKLTQTGIGNYPLASFAILDRKWEAAKFLIRLVDKPMYMYPYYDEYGHAQVTGKKGTSVAKTTLLLEAVHYRAPLDVVAEILSRRDLKNINQKFLGKTAVEWAEHSLARSTETEEFAKYQRYDEALLALLKEHEARLGEKEDRGLFALDLFEKRDRSPLM